MVPILAVLLAARVEDHKSEPKGLNLKSNRRELKPVFRRPTDLPQPASKMRLPRILLVSVLVAAIAYPIIVTGGGLRLPVLGPTSRAPGLRKVSTGRSGVWRDGCDCVGVRAIPGFKIETRGTPDCGWVRFPGADAAILVVGIPIRRIERRERQVQPPISTTRTGFALFCTGSASC